MGNIGFRDINVVVRKFLEGCREDSIKRQRSKKYYTDEIVSCDLLYFFCSNYLLPRHFSLRV